MIVFGIVFGIWLVVGLMVFALLFDPEDWYWAAGLAAMWPAVAIMGAAASFSGSLAEFKEKIRKRLEPDE